MASSITTIFLQCNSNRLYSDFLIYFIYNYSFAANKNVKIKGIILVTSKHYFFYKNCLPFLPFLTQPNQTKNNI